MPEKLFVNKLIIIIKSEDFPLFFFKTKLSNAEWRMAFSFHNSIYNIPNIYTVPFSFIGRDFDIIEKQ